MTWIDEAAFPVAPTSGFKMSQIYNNYVYIQDRGTNFWKYDLYTDQFTALTNRPAGLAGNICLCLWWRPTTGKIYTCCQTRYIYIYDIATNTWSVSSISPVGWNVYVLTFQDEDTIWAFCDATSLNKLKCLKYVISTDTWTEYSASWNHTYPEAYMFEGTFYNGKAYVAPVSGGSFTHLDYNPSTDTYTRSPISTSYQYAYGCSPDTEKLWFYNKTTGQIGYYDLQTSSPYATEFSVNPSLAGPSYSYTIGVRDYATGKACIAHARNTPPRLMSEYFTPTFPNHPYVIINDVDVSAYILGIHIERGEDAELAEATTGTCQLTCDNHNGDFSPENTGGAFYPDLQIGAVVEVYEIFEDVRYDLFKGRIDSIDPLAERANPYAYIVVLDGQDDMKGTKISTALRTNTDSGVLVGDILDAVGWAAGDRSIDTGTDVLQLGWFHKIDGLEGIRILERVENGRFFVSPTGIATWHNRHHRLTGDGLVSQFDVAEQAVELDFEYNKRLVKNVINLRGRRYYSGGGATLFSGYDLATLDSDLVWSAHAGDAGAPYVPQQTTLTLWADMNAPLAAYDTLVKGTHWNANTEADKSGIDVSDNITLTQTQYGQSVKLEFENTGSVGAYLVVPDTPPTGAPSDRTVLVYGTLYGEEVMVLTEEDETSKSDYGIRSLDLDLPFKSNPNDIVSYAQYLKRKYKDAIPRAVSVKLAHRTNWPDTTIKIQCLSREIGDRITVASSRLGFDRDFYINKIVHDYAFNEGGIVAETTWYIERAAGTVDEVFWILGEVGFSEIGETTYLGF